MKLADLLLGGGSRSTSFQGYGDPGGAAPGDAGDGGGEWWQDEAGAWHFGGEAQRWWRDEHHQWHQGGEFQLWRQDEQGNWHEVNEDHPKNSEDELMMEGPSDMGDPQQDIKDLDALNGAMTEDFPPMDRACLKRKCLLPSDGALPLSQVSLGGPSLLAALFGFGRAARRLELRCDPHPHLGTPTAYEAEEIFHPGHEAVHVTRLHRYEHEGMASFLEARWKDSKEAADVFWVPRCAFVGAEAPGFETPGLRARFQVAGSSSQGPPSHVAPPGPAGRGLWVQRSGRCAQERYHGLEVPDENHPAETRLTSLESQYIGQIGVGSVLYPSGCEPKSESLIYLGPAEYAKASEEQKKSCHVRDESLVWVVFDTGSTNIWVSSVLCTRGPCASSSRSRYNRTNSRTALPPRHSGTLQIEFGTGRIAGPEGVDDFHIGPFSVYKQTFGMIESEDGRVFEEVPVEGILGLAFPAMAANGIRPFVDGIIENKAIGKNEFAFYFSPDDVAGNAVFWGGVDHAFYRGDIEYFPVVEPYYWSVELADFKIGDDSLLGLLLPEGEGELAMSHSHKKRHHRTTFKAIVDTGTTFFTAQGRLFREVMSRLSVAPCNRLTEESHPNITYTLVNTAGSPRDFVITNKQYMLASSEGEEAECTPAFMLIDVPRAHGPGMVLGEVFLRIFFSVFDRGSGRVDEARLGLAASIHDASSKFRLKACKTSWELEAAPRSEKNNKFHRPQSGPTPRHMKVMPRIAEPRDRVRWQAILKDGIGPILHSVHREYRRSLGGSKNELNSCCKGDISTERHLQEFEKANELEQYASTQEAIAFSEKGKRRLREAAGVYDASWEMVVAVGNLSQDRIAAMTSEDVPNMVTPVADSLKEVIRNAKSLKDHLTAISDAAYSIVGSAAEDAERRLSGAPLETEEEGPEDEMGHGYDEYGGYGGYGDEYGGGYGGGYGGEYGGYGGEYGGYGDHGHGGAHGDMGHGVAVSAIPGMATTPRS
ncbi:unnamed protein product [Effrenium voratum]|nr:unnamed protein product [Effrenium voratum]